MSETFEKVLVKDDRLGCITSKVKFQVFKGGQNITSQPFKAISETTAAHTYNITVPSLETIINREALWRSTVTLKIDAIDKNQAEFAVTYGVTDALSAFPLHSLVNTMTATINNNTISQNVADTLPILLRLVDPEEFAKYDGMTPTTLDYLAHYEDGVSRMPYQMGFGGPAANLRPVIFVPGTSRQGRFLEAIHVQVSQQQRACIRPEPTIRHFLLSQAAWLVEDNADLRQGRRWRSPLTHHQ